MERLLKPWTWLNRKPAVLKEETVEKVAVALTPPVDIILIQITTRAMKTDSPSAFLKHLWPCDVFADAPSSSAVLASTAGSRIRPELKTAMYRSSIGGPWKFLIATHRTNGQAVGCEMYLHLDDPGKDLTNYLSGLLTPLGSELVNHVCMATMTTVKEIINHRGHTLLVLNPPAVDSVFDQFTDAVQITLSKK